MSLSTFVDTCACWCVIAVHFCGHLRTLVCYVLSTSVDTVTYFYGHCILMMVNFCGNNICKSCNRAVFLYQGYVRVKLQCLFALRQFAYFPDFCKPVLIHFIFQTFGQIY